MKKSLIPLNYSQFLIAWGKARDRHKIKQQKLEDQLKLFQSTCKHEKTRFQGDPAGGSDSCYICFLCDKVM